MATNRVESTGSQVTDSIQSQLDALTAAVNELTAQNHRLAARGEVENLFNRYHFFHNAFRDDLIKDLWVKRGTPGIRAIYTNTGEYTDYESVMEYHENRPAPKGKLILHMSTTPVIEAAPVTVSSAPLALAETEPGLPSFAQPTAPAPVVHVEAAAVEMPAPVTTDLPLFMQGMSEVAAARTATDPEFRASTPVAPDRSPSHRDRVADVRPTDLAPSLLPAVALSP